MDTLFLLDDACRIDMHNPPNLESGYQEDEQSHAEENAYGPIPTVRCVEFLKGNDGHLFAQRKDNCKDNQISQDVDTTEQPNRALK